MPPYRSRESIRVCEYFVTMDGTVEWKTRGTDARVGTEDEYYFWRVLSQGAKQFFLSPEQWMDYSGHDGAGLDDVVAQWHERYDAMTKADSDSRPLPQ
jgi:hypothetical protein